MVQQARGLHGVDLAPCDGGSGITGKRASQDKHGDFKFDTDAGVKGSEQRSTSAANGPLLLERVRPPQAACRPYGWRTNAAP